MFVEQMSFRRAADDVSVGLDVGSVEAVPFLAPAIGPTGTLLAGYAANAVRDGGTVVWDVRDVATLFGVQPGVLVRAVERLVRFELLFRCGEVWEVRCMLPVLPGGVSRRLPSWLRDVCPYMEVGCGE